MPSSRCTGHRPGVDMTVRQRGWKLSVTSWGARGSGWLRVGRPARRGHAMSVGSRWRGPFPVICRRVRIGSSCWTGSSGIANGSVPQRRCVCSPSGLINGSASGISVRCWVVPDWIRLIGWNASRCSLTGTRWPGWWRSSPRFCGPLLLLLLLEGGDESDEHVATSLLGLLMERRGDLLDGVTTAFADSGPGLAEPGVEAFPGVANQPRLVVVHSGEDRAGSGGEPLRRNIRPAPDDETNQCVRTPRAGSARHRRRDVRGR